MCRGKVVKRATVAALALVAAVPAMAADPSEGDLRSLRTLAQQMDKAWTAGDADANAALFAPGATARFGNDPLGEGREAIRGQFRSFFRDRPPGLRHVTNIERIEQLGPDLALWDAEVRVEQQHAAGTWVALTIIRNVTIAVRQPGGWRIKSVRAFPLPR